MVSGYEIKYVSASGEALDLSGGGIDATPTALKGWELEAIEINNKVAGLRRSNPQYEIPLIVVAGTEEAGVEAKNALHDIPAADRDRLTPGRMYVNDWYISGYMTASAVDNYWQYKGAAQYVLKFMATEPKWTRERTFRITGGSGGSGEWLDFPYDFAYDLGGSAEVSTVENANYFAAPALIRIYGPAVNPFVTVGGNTYQANVTLGAGDRLELDGAESTATVIRNNGAVENAFQHLQGEFAKDSGSYAFQPVPVGVSEVNWPGSYDIDVVVYERREEPRWS